MEKNRLINIPEDVVNPKEYKKMFALQQHPVIRNTIYHSSEGDEINIAMLPHRLRKFIEHLSPKEQEHIMELKRQYNVMRAKITNAKAQAYGRAGCYGGKKKEEIALYRLSPFEEDIIELLGRMFTVAEVVKIMGEDYSIIVNEDDVKDILKKHIVEIERKREEFRNRVADVRLYNKRPRLEELAWMYSKMKARYVSLNGIDAYASMLRTLEQIRKEAEGDVININGSMDINVEVTIQNHIQKEIFKTINLKEIILGRVAARMNFDTKKLIAGLHNSYYAKFVDISGDYDPNADMSYPSQSSYDFTMIEKTAGQNNVIDVKSEEITEIEKSSAERAKELFLSKIRKQKQEIESRQAGFDAIAEIKRPIASEEENFNRSVNRGRGKDKIPPSQTKAGQYKNKNTEYYSGDKKKK
jgi:hypothetical protein